MTPTFYDNLNGAIELSRSLLCVGLDLDGERMPERFRRVPDGYLEFAREIIDATADAAAAYKPNFAFFESHGIEGWRMLEKLRELIPSHSIALADAKRGDIGNTSRHYARAIFNSLGYDAVTLSPYMGRDSLEPFFEYSEKGCFVLCATSNPGADDFQIPNQLYMSVADRCLQWNSRDNIGLVVGATRTDCISAVRKKAPQIPFLVPGIGAQGGDLKKVLLAGKDPHARGMLINASRSILYASAGDDFAEAAQKEAHRLAAAINAHR